MPAGVAYRGEVPCRPAAVRIDVQGDALATDAHRQSVQLAAADHVGDDQDFVESVSIGLDDQT